MGTRGLAALSAEDRNGPFHPPRVGTAGERLKGRQVKMAPNSTLSSKGQITIPLEIRRRLGLKEGDRVEFVVEGERTIIRPAQSPKNPFEKYLGALPAFRSEREMNAWVSSLRDEEAVEAIQIARMSSDQPG
jgi:antitoxin PrlF